MDAMIPCEHGQYEGHPQGWSWCEDARLQTVDDFNIEAAAQERATDMGHDCEKKATN